MSHKPPPRDWVHCLWCGYAQPDEMKEGATCGRCGSSPMPSRTYPKGYFLYPKLYVPKLTLGQLLKKAREMRKDEP
jgi:hypothetical protein